HMCAQARRMALPFAFEADDCSQGCRKEKSCRDYGKGQPCRLTHVGKQILHANPPGTAIFNRRSIQRRCVTLVPGRTRSADAEDESPHENVRLGKHESPERPAFLDLPPSTSLLELCEGCPKTALFQKHVAYGEYGVASGTCDANELVKAGG